MTISNRVKSAIEQKDSLLKSESVAQCIKFTKEMEQLGLIRPDNCSVLNPAEGGLQQLKLFSIENLSCKL